MFKKSCFRSPRSDELRPSPHRQHDRISSNRKQGSGILLCIRCQVWWLKLLCESDPQCLYQVSCSNVQIEFQGEVYIKEWCKSFKQISISFRHCAHLYMKYQGILELFNFELESFLLESQPFFGCIVKIILLRKKFFVCKSVILSVCNTIVSRHYLKFLQ